MFMSDTARKVLSILNEIFPPYPRKRIVCEYYVFYKNERLYFDFFIRDLSVFIEVQGHQHVTFIKHFHGDADGFKRQKLRDNLKIQYVQENNMSLARIYDTEDVDRDLVLRKIKNALEFTFYE
jgi:hypothetical protein